MNAELGIANPMRTDGFEFVEYAAPDPELLRRLFESMGLPAVARHRSKNVTLHNHGDINFIINAEHDSFAQKFARAHGPCACAMAFRVADARLASALRSAGQDVARRLQAIHCPVHGKTATNVRVHFDERGGADLQYDSCCEHLGKSIGEALG